MQTRLKRATQESELRERADAGMFCLKDKDFKQNMELPLNASEQDRVSSSANKGPIDFSIGFLFCLQCN